MFPNLARGASRVSQAALANLMVYVVYVYPLRDTFAASAADEVVP